MIRIFSSLFFSLITLWAPSAVATVSCSGSPDELNCLVRNFGMIYMDNYHEFWTIVRKSADEARQCTSDAKTAEFLNLARIQTGNAEFGEFFSENVEKLCLTAPSCFNKAAYLLPSASQQKLKDMLYKPPLFHDETDFRKAGGLVKPDR